MSQRKHYSREFKLEAVRLLEQSDKPIAELARELGIRRNLLYKWRDTLSEKSEAAFPGAGRKRDFEEEKLFENLEAMWEILGRQPKTPDFSTSASKYSVDTYKRRFGSLRKSLEAFLEFVNTPPREPATQSTEAKPSWEHSKNSQPSQHVKRHRTGRNVSYKLRFMVMRRDGFKCKFCGATPASDPGTKLVIDHVIPWSSGGETTIDNLQTLCEVCNSGKSNLSL